jgi:hypothetical protein
MYLRHVAAVSSVLAGLCRLIACLYSCVKLGRLLYIGLVQHLGGVSHDFPSGGGLLYIYRLRSIQHGTLTCTMGESDGTGVVI